MESEELLEIALDCLFPKTQHIEKDILAEITGFLEANSKGIPEKDAEIVRGEIRKAMIHFKNRPYLYATRKKVESFLKKDENMKRFSIAPLAFVEELKNVGLSNEEIDGLRNSITAAKKTYKLIQTIPTPKSCS